MGTKSGDFHQKVMSYELRFVETYSQKIFNKKYLYETIEI